MTKIRIFALIAALLTAVSVYFYLASLNKPEPVVLVNVIAASQAIPARTKITAEMVKTVQFPPSAVHPSAARNTADVVGSIADVRIEADEPILTTKLVNPEEVKGNLSYRIDNGMRAITIPVDQVAGVASYIAANDTVDILSIMDKVETLADGTLESETYSYLLLQDVKVLSVGSNQQNQPGAANIEYATVTLLVTPEQALKLNLAAAKGSIRLVLRSPLDNDQPKVPAQTVDKLMP